MEPIFRNLSGQGAMTLDVPTESHILEYQWRMLQDNPVAGLLPLSCLVRDGTCMLSWRTTSLQPLTLMFARECWHIRDLLYLVRQLFRILSAMEALMLDPWRLMLDNRFILMDPVTLEMHLAYLPLSNMEESENPIRELLQRWVMGECRLEKGGDPLALSALVAMLNDSGFHWRQLASCCVSAGIMQATPSPVQEDTNNKPPSVSSGQNSIAGYTPSGTNRRSITSDNGAVRAVPGEGSCLLVPKAGNPYGERIDVSIRIPARNRNGSKLAMEDAQEKGKEIVGFGWKFFLLQGAVLAVILAAAGGGVMAEKGTDGLSAWIGLVLVAGALEALAFSKRSGMKSGTVFVENEDAEGCRRQEKDRDAAPPMRLERKPYTGLGEKHAASPQSALESYGRKQDMTGATRNANRVSESLEEREVEAVPASASDIPIPAETTDAMPGGHGISINAASQDEMCFRQDQTERLPAYGGRYLLHHRADGKDIRLEISKCPFLLGRMHGYVDGCLDHPAVGKIHAEIREGQGGLVLVDLNSRNGTRINGILLDPYCESALSPGDILRLAKEELTYSCDAVSFA